MCVPILPKYVKVTNFEDRVAVLEFQEPCCKCKPCVIGPWFTKITRVALAAMAASGDSLGALSPQNFDPSMAYIGTGASMFCNVVDTIITCGEYCMEGQNNCYPKCCSSIFTAVAFGLSTTALVLEFEKNSAVATVVGIAACFANIASMGVRAALPPAKIKYQPAEMNEEKEATAALARIPLPEPAMKPMAEENGASKNPSENV